MLQQTRVATVIPYFERWLAAFPDFASLARAGEPEVMRLWQGLGYYSRARNLHKLAQRVIGEGVPNDFAGWLALPGVGGYTAAAISSIAQGLPEAVVDGNVVRVLARLMADGTTWKTAGEAVKAFKLPAWEFLDRENPSGHNEAIMELGALICLPRAPLCTICPLARHCQGARSGIAAGLPRIEKARKIEKTVRRAWIVRGKKILLQEIPVGAKRLGGMLELPLVEDLPSEAKPDPEPFAKRKRGIGNESITEWIHRVPLSGDVSPHPNLRWVSLNSLEAESLSGPHRRWIGELERHEPHP